jgi:hypothetical protein
MIRTYALQTLLAVASAVATVGLLAAGAAGDRALAPSTACPLVDSILAGALPFAAAPQPASGAAAGAPQTDA